MCGRYNLNTSARAFADAYGVVLDVLRDINLARFNIAPTQTLPVVAAVTGGERQVLMARWGLIPAWVKDAGALQQPINAKMETAAEKPMFRRALARSRVLVPASGFYEWKPGGARKQPFNIGMADGGLFAMGGLLERWQGPEGEVLSYCVLTTAANDLVSDIHARMPVIIAPEHYAQWLAPDLVRGDAIAAMATPYAAGAMRAYPVSTRVNSVRNDGPELLEPLPEIED
ncbi:MAG: SOS response-associated peptidase [Rhodocyclaceae bacterium]|nr:SOS response-associated peptidase [Rhodocyclaceae bacterium]MBX3667796.1 SOS response-associated peptidase [Rhodocyclaceae bacterium]